MLAPLIKHTRRRGRRGRKKYNKSNRNCISFRLISVCLTNLLTSALTAQSNTHKTKDLRHKLAHLTPTTPTTMRTVHRNFVPLSRRNFNLPSEFATHRAKMELNKTRETIAMRYGYNRRCLSVQMAKSMGRKIKRKVKPKKIDNKIKETRKKPNTIIEKTESTDESRHFHRLPVFMGVPGQWKIASITMKP